MNGLKQARWEEMVRQAEAEEEAVVAAEAGRTHAEREVAEPVSAAEKAGSL